MFLEGELLSEKRHFSIAPFPPFFTLPFAILHYVSSPDIWLPDQPN